MLPSLVGVLVVDAFIWTAIIIVPVAVGSIVLSVWLCGKYPLSIGDL